MGFWSIVVPETTTNYAQNPSFEDNITDDWTSSDLGAGAVFTHSSTHAKYGAYSGQITAGNGEARYVQDTFSLANNSSLYASVWIWTDGGADDAQINIRDTTTPANRANTNNTTGSAWERLETYWTNTTGGAVNVRLELKNLAADSATNVWFDGAQAEIDTSDYTTYCDGTQSGCEWNGASHNSTSTRSALSRAGGVVYDLTDDYGFYVTGFLDTGVAPLTQHLDEYAIIPGGEISSYKVHPRVLTLQGTMISRVSFATLHDQIQALYDILKPDAVPNNQPILLRYTEATVTKEIAVRYEGGLGANWRGENCAKQNMALRFVAADPFWYEVGESGAVLDTEDTPTLRYVAGRLKSTGQWDDLGLTNNPTTGGAVLASVVGPDNKLYIAGTWTGLDAVANRDYIAAYDITTDTWETLGAIGDFTITIRCLAFGPDGTLYAGGDFNIAGGDVADHIAQWDGAAWAAVGNPLAGAAVINSVRKFAFDRAGNLYIVGQFTAWNNIAAANGIVMWDGAAYAAVGATGFVIGDRVDSIALDAADNIYIGGLFANCGGDADADNIAYYNGTAWANVGGGLSSSVFALKYDPALDLFYVGGNFANAGGDASADKIAIWNGQSYLPMGTGVSGATLVYDIQIAENGQVYAVGSFTDIGGVTNVSGIARWNGDSWLHSDVDPPVAWAIYTIAMGRPDPVEDNIQDIFIGWSTTGAASIGGLATVTTGTRLVYPTIHIARAGGTSATLTSIRNETLGIEMAFEYSLLDGETLTIDLQPQTRNITSSFFPGSQLGSLLNGSDFSSWHLAPGANNISAYVIPVGAPTVTATMVWRDTYWSND